MKSKNTLLAMLAISVLIITGCWEYTDTNTVTVTKDNSEAITIIEDSEIEILEFVSVIIYDGKEGIWRSGPAPDEIIVSLTLNDDQTIAGYENIHNPTHPKSRQYWPRFENAIEGSVIGKTLDEVKFSKAGGASTTTEARNAAIEDIQDQI